MLANSILWSTFYFNMTASMNLGCLLLSWFLLWWCSMPLSIYSTPLH